MKILFPMTYYRPYVSGPIIYVENLARELVERGHEVTILTSKHQRDLAADEESRGIRIVRTGVLARVSKGVVSPGFYVAARRLARSHDAIVVQIPQLEAGFLVAVARRYGCAPILTYHCDVQLPTGGMNRVIERTLDRIHRYAVSKAQGVAAYTSDYAEHSRVLGAALDRVTIIRPPVSIPRASDDEARAFRERHHLGQRPAVGICARLSTEKGFDRLLDALPRLLERHPEIVVVHAGETEAVAGEEQYRDRVLARFAVAGNHWLSVGVLHDRELAAFYRACNVTVLPSVNGTEAFGLVQVESMLNGTPVVASELPGVRVPISDTGMGVHVPVEGVRGLADGILEVLEHPEAYTGDAAQLTDYCAVERAADGYETLLAGIVGR